MLYTKEQIVSGLQDYLENEVISQLPTAGKVVAGTCVALAVKDNESFINNLMNNYGKLLGIVNDDGLLDADSVLKALRSNINHYGCVTIDLPLGIGRLIFNEEDIDVLRRYIK